MDIEIKPKNPFLKKYGWMITAGIVFVAVLVYAGLSAGTTSAEADINSIIIGDVTRGSFNDNIRLTGKVETGVSAQVSALETGVVEARLIEEGAFVNAGDIILTLRNPNLRQQILDSESQLAEKQNMLRDTEIAMEKDRLQIKQDLLVARTELNRKRRVARQQEELYKEKLTSREEYLVAQEDCQLAEENYQLLLNRERQDSLYRGVQLDMMRESLRNMQENFMLVRQRADNLNIRASHSGQLGSLNAELGQNIAAGTQVGQINILDNYKMTVSIDEHYIDRVSAGLKAVAARQNQKIDLTLSKVYPEVTDGTFRADFTIDDDSTGNLRVGQTYSIDLVLGEPSQAVMVPRGTFFQSTGGRSVYVLSADGKSAFRRDVRLGRQNPQFFEVVEGLEPGERIITSSYQNFGDAKKIIIRNLTDKTMELQIKNLRKVFRTDSVQTVALNDVSFNIADGSFVAVMGPSGCGKSTLLNILGLLDNPTDGRYFLDGQEVGSLKEAQRTRYRQGRIGFIFQSFNLIEEMNIRDNIMLPLNNLPLSKAEKKQRVDEAMNRMGIAHRANHYPSQLSGGQQQRAAIARAIVARPGLILADEPTGNLDSKNGLEVMGLLSELHREGSTIIMVTHSQRDAAYADYVINLFDGSIVENLNNKM